MMVAIKGSDDGCHGRQCNLRTSNDNCESGFELNNYYIEIPLEDLSKTF